MGGDPGGERRGRLNGEADPESMTEDRTRDLAIEAACLLVQEGDIESLSVESVAAAADLDEDRLRAVFPTTEDLLQAVGGRTYETFVGAVEQEVGDDESDGAFTRAYVRAAIRSLDRDRFDVLVATLLASAPFRPHMVDPIREQQATVNSALRSDGIDPVLAIIIRLAVDGLWFNNMFGVLELEPATRAAVATRLEALATPATPC